MLGALNAGNQPSHSARQDLAVARNRHHDGDPRASSFCAVSQLGWSRLCAPSSAVRRPPNLKCPSQGLTMRSTPMTSEYHLLELTGMDACSVDRDWFNQTHSQWECSGCGLVRPDVGPVDSVIGERTPPGHSPMNGIWGTGLFVASWNILELFGAETIARDLHIGRLFVNGGRRQLSDWVTFHGKKLVVVRGSKKVGYRRCSKCGRQIYFAVDSSYLSPEPNEPGTLLQWSRGLVIRGSLPSGLSGPLTGVRVTPLPVLSEPRDGLPADLR